MGTKYLGIPKDIVMLLLENFEIRNFVETGTYYGATATWASQFFENVISIEKSDDLWEMTSSKFNNFSNIEFLLGDSREMLEVALLKLEEPILIWLDAHWSGGKTAGMSDECPLMGELEVINSFDKEVFILIDDARLFLSPPPRPHNPENWPEIGEVLAVLREKSRYVTIMDDVINAFPMSTKSTLIDCLQNKSTVSWEKSRKRRTSLLKTVVKRILGSS